MIRYLKLLWFDIHGYFHIRKTIRKHKKSVDFTRLGLRVDWVNRVYTVINPSPEDKGDGPDVLKIKAQHKMLPIHKYIEQIELSDYVSVSAEQVPNSDSYLLVYYPIFRVLNLWKIFWFFVLIGGCVWAGIKFLT